MKNFIKKNMAKMKNKNYLLVLLTFFLFIQCESNEQKRFELAEKNMKEKWDQESYLELKDAVFYYSADAKDYIKYSYIMANCFNDGSACYDVASNIMNMYYQNKLKLDSAATSQVIYYFEKGANLGDNNCKNALYLLFCKGGAPCFNGMVEIDSARASKYKISY